MLVTFYNNDGEIQETRDDLRIADLSGGTLTLVDPDNEMFEYDVLEVTPTKFDWFKKLVAANFAIFGDVNDSQNLVAIRLDDIAER